jgi:SAM-dependent methyltransferase
MSNNSEKACFCVHRRIVTSQRIFGLQDISVDIPLTLYPGAFTRLSAMGERVTEHSHPQTLEAHFQIAMLKNMEFGNTAPVRDGRYVQLGAGKKFIRNWVNLDYPEWDAEKMPLPFADEEVDGIASYHTLDHIKAVIPLLAEIQRVLVPGGWFVNIVPHYDSELWHSDLTHVSQFGTETWRSIFSTRHYNHDAVEGHTDWHMKIKFNMVMAVTERNAVLVTKLVKED